MDEFRLSRAARDPATASLPALIAGDATLTFADLDARAAPVRAALARDGVAPGSRVAFVARCAVETVITVHALLDLGATLVPLHPRLTPPEVAALLADAAPHLTLPDPALPPSSPSLPLSPSPDLLSPSLPLAILYTSGTTGRPKGAVLSRRAFAASAAASAANLGFLDDDRWLLCMPLAHVGGLSVVTRCLAARRAVVLEPRFDPDAVLAAILRARVTLLSVVPTMLAALLERDAAGTLARLRAVLVGGAATPFALLEECARRGVPALATYGLTEACSQVTAQRLARPCRAARGSGEPLPGVGIRVARPDGSAAPAGEVGRIGVRGPTLMDGYFRGADRPLDLARDAEGWFDTGDLGEVDAAGTLHVHARRHDLVVTGGENVYPVEVEQALEALPGVRRALVFGVPDERWGQIVAAAIELAPGAALAALAAPLAASLAPHKRPRLAAAVAALPLTPSGKLERAAAAERYAAVLRPFGGRSPRRTAAAE